MQEKKCNNILFEILLHFYNTVIPAKAGIQDNTVIARPPKAAEAIPRQLSIVSLDLSP
jgi:hypothetical protein